jgi:hypothetical protein
VIVDEQQREQCDVNGDKNCQRKSIWPRTSIMASTSVLS